MRVGLTRWAFVSVALLAACGGGDGGGTTGPTPSGRHATKSSGDAQAGLVGTSLAAPLVVRVADAGGAPLARVAVTFAVAAGGGHVDPASSTTNAQGLAQTTWTLGSTVGTQGVTATAAGVSGSLTFTASATRGQPAMAKTSGDQQQARVSSTLPAPLVVTVTDGTGAPVANVGVTFRVLTGGGSVSQTTVITDAQGHGQVTWALGPEPGTQEVIAVLEGASTQSVTFTATAPVVATAAQQRLATDGGFTCAITMAGVLSCWGTNGNGELGDNTNLNHYTPAPVHGGVLFKAVTAGGGFACALTASGTPYCWGFNFWGQLGNGSRDSDPHPLPRAVAGAPPRFVQIRAGADFVCGLTAGGTVYCWGTEAGMSATSPTLVSTDLAFTTIDAGGGDVCGVTQAGAAYCWGSNPYGQLGDGTQTDRTRPVAVLSGLTFTQIAVSGSHTCGLLTSGQAACWGLNDDGQLGNGATGTQELLPVLVGGGLSFQQIDVGGGFTCGLTGSQVQCWGTNGGGALGRGFLYGNYPTPAPVTGGLQFTSLSVGVSYACGFLSSGGAACWGQNYGQLGDGTNDTTGNPVLVAGGMTF